MTVNGTPRPGHRYSTLGSWSNTIVRALEAQGIDGKAIALAAGLDTDTFRDNYARVPRETLTKLWRLAVEATGDPCFGLTVVRYAAPASFHALGYAVLASDTFREALERIIRYRRLIGDVVRLSLEDDGESTRFIVDVSSAPGAVPDEAVDAFAATIAKQARVVCANPNFHPSCVSLRRPKPPDTSLFSRTFQAPVLFSQRRNFIEYPRASLEKPLPAANAELARQNDEAVVRYLAQLETAGVTHRTQQALLDALPNGRCTKEIIARRLGMSPRNLQRHLEEESTSFKELLNQTRMSLARSYLEEGRLPITEIAFVLGFSDTSAFSRAFKRWTGQPARTYGVKPRTTGG